jgi:hypothetical protein
VRNACGVDLARDGRGWAYVHMQEDEERRERRREREDRREREERRAHRDRHSDQSDEGREWCRNDRSGSHDHRTPISKHGRERPRVSETETPTIRGAAPSERGGRGYANTNQILQDREYHTPTSARGAEYSNSRAHAYSEPLSKHTPQRSPFSPVPQACAFPCLGIYGR